MKSLSFGCGAIVSALMVLAARPALADVVYSTSGGSAYSIGDNLDTKFDQLILAPGGGTFTLPGTIVLNTLTFNVGVNSCCVYDPTNLPPLSETLTIGNVSETLDIGYKIHIDYSDTITILAGTPLTFGSYSVAILPQVLGPDPVGSYTGTLEANVTFNSNGGPVSPIPEASTWAMMVLGFLGIGFLAYRRRENEPVLRLT